MRKEIKGEGREREGGRERERERCHLLHGMGVAKLSRSLYQNPKNTHAVLGLHALYM